MICEHIFAAAADDYNYEYDDDDDIDDDGKLFMHDCVTVILASAMIIVMLRCASWRCDVFYFIVHMTCLCIVIVECTCVHACALA